MMQPDRYFESIRREQSEELRRRTAEIHKRIPALSAADEQRRALFSAVARGEITAKDAAERTEELNAETARLLKENGFEPDALELRYRCPLCRDTGWTGSERRSPCRCRLLYSAENDPSVGINARETFANFSETVYPDAEQLARANRIKNFCLKYADRLPDTEKRDLLLMGRPGTGKSFFGNAIAYRALERGIAARRITASDLIRETLRGLETRTVNDRFREVPLLVLDDLGTEPMIPNVSEETLFALVEGRDAHGLPTVIITNLDGAQLQERYGERLTSRIVDSETTAPISFTGKNLRWRRATC